MLDTSIVATSMYTIAAEFDEIEAINWVALAYTLTFLSFAVLFARISDVIGRRDTFLICFVIFIAFSLGCGFAKTLNQLIVCRALQGLGGSGLYSIAIIVFPEVTPEKKKNWIAGIFGVVIAVAGVLGPVIGGLLTHYASWRWIFWINGSIGAVSAVAFFLSWPKKEYLPNIERRKWKDLDYLGSFLLIAASTLICFAFQNGAMNTLQWGQAVFIAPIVFGVLCILCIFPWTFFVEHHWREKLACALPVTLIRNRVYNAGVLNTMFMGFPYLLCIYVFPIRFQVVHGKSALQSGLMLLPMLASSAAGSTIAGAANSKKNKLAETLIAAILLMIVGCAALTTVKPTEGYEPKVLGFLVFVGLGFGLSAAASTMLGITESPIWEHAPAQGIIAQMRILGGSIGIAASSAILGVKTRNQLSGILSPSQLRGLAGQMSTLTPEQATAVRVAYTDALKEDMVVCCAVLAVGFFLTCGVYRRGRLSLAARHQQQLAEEHARHAAAAGGNVVVGQGQPAAAANQGPAVPGDGTSSSSAWAFASSGSVEQWPGAAEGNKASAPGNQVPASGNQLAAGGNQVPAAANQAPTAANQAPAAANQAPAAANQTATAGNQASAGGRTITD
ncbi:major facilitator superfamily transporter [Coniochaeta sp. 2T2.1]|nr:major facilitator superfamily transporter [Coniochaeta sp. 2T2.1]